MFLLLLRKPVSGAGAVAHLLHDCSFLPLPRPPRIPGVGKAHVWLLCAACKPKAPREWLCAEAEIATAGPAMHAYCSALALTHSAIFMF